jgi:diguanylate cyclase (GGDEF)-like protein/PAS domain S-box-containing protein
MEDHEAWALIHPDDREDVQAAWRDSLNHSLELEVRARMRTPDGHVRWTDTRATPVSDAAGELIGFAGSVLDLTNVMDAKSALRDSETRARAVVDALTEGVVIYDAQGRVQAMNPSAESILGGSRSDLESRRISWDVWDPVYLDGSPVAPDEHPARKALRTGEAQNETTIGVTPPGRSRVWLVTNARPLTRDEDGEVYSVVLSFADISSRKRTEDALRDSESHLRSLSEAVPVGVFRTNMEGRLTYVNPRWTEITGLDSQEAFRLEPFELFHPEDRERGIQGVTEAWQRGASFDDQLRILARDGSTKWVQYRQSVIRDKFGTPTGAIGSIEDVSPLIDAQEQSARLATIVETTSDLVSIIDEETGAVLYLNAAARDLLGYPDPDLGDLALAHLLNEDSDAVYIEQVRPVLLRDDTWSGELVLRTTAGEDRHVWMSVAGEFDSDGVLVRLSFVGRDVTDRRRAEAELAHQATHDPLTGLPNRALLLNHLDLAIARSKRDNTLVGLLFLDLDRFKSVNDNRGHDVGDELLRQVSQRIAGVLRPSDTVARLGGDEFVVLFTEVDDERHGLTVAQRVVTAIEHEPFALPDLELSVTTSAGLALSSDIDHPEALLRDADAAMYRAKEKGRARLELYDEAMRRRSALRVTLANQLSEAIETGDIDVHYQPAVNLRTGEVIAVEALARWEHPERGLLSPGEFINLAEDTGLIVGLGLAVMHQACEQALQWQREMGPSAPVVAVNLSARQLAHGNLPSLVRGVLANVGLDASRVCLEITESVLMEDPGAAVETLQGLKEIGVQLAIDDFGTGSSSLSYLRRFPIDLLKVDRSFVDGLGPDPEDSAIVAAIVSLAHTLDRGVVAEGVETVEQLSELRALGCDAAQGYLFARPQPADAVTPYLHRLFAV